MKKEAKPATRRRCAKLHLWIYPASQAILAAYCETFKIDKTAAVEKAIDMLGNLTAEANSR